MFLILKVKKNFSFKDDCISVITSSLDNELKALVYSIIERKIEADNNIEKLHNSIFNFIHETKSFYAFIETISDGNKDYVISILLDDSLTYIELFQNEIKHYLKSMLNTKNLTFEKFNWKTNCVLYLPKFIQKYRSILSEIIFSAIQGFSIVLKNIPESEMEEINRFSLNFEILDMKDKEKSDSTTNVVFDNIDGKLFSNLTVSDESCKKIANKLCEIENIILLKGVINDFILEVNKELNIVRRMLNKAVGDFYINYQLYRYILTSDKREILHHHLELNEDISTKEKEILNLTLDLIKE